MIDPISVKKEPIYIPIFLPYRSETGEAGKEPMKPPTKIIVVMRPMLDAFGLPMSVGDVNRVAQARGHPPSGTKSLKIYLSTTAP